MTPTAVLRCLRDPGEARPIHLGRALTCGGAEGVRTPDPHTASVWPSIVTSVTMVLGL